jgi:hypothetical protein
MKMVTIQVRVDTDWVYDIFTAGMIQTELVRAEQEFYNETGTNRNRRFNIVRMLDNPRTAKIQVLENGKPVPNEDILVPSHPPIFQNNSELTQSEMENDGMLENDGTMHFPPVDPAELSARWKLMHGIISKYGNQPVMDMREEEDQDQSEEVKKAKALNAQAVHGRAGMLFLMEKHGLLKDWIHNGELNEVAVRVMAKYQLEPMKVGVPRKAPYYEILDAIKKAADGGDAGTL